MQAICVCLIRSVRSFDRQYGALLRETAEVLAQYLVAVRHPRVVDVATQVLAWGGASSSHIHTTGLCLECEPPFEIR